MNSKFLFLIAVLLSLNPIMKAQTNAFPASGNVGVGTSTPNALLSLGAAPFTKKLAIYDDGTDMSGLGQEPYQLRLFFPNTHWNHLAIGSYAATTHTFNEFMRIAQTGNVGIGTASPQAKLQIGNVNLDQNLANGITIGSTTNAYLAIGQGGGRNVLLGWMTNADPSKAYALLETYSGNNPLVLQYAGGSVGIGTTTPGSYKLAVEGKVGARKVVVTQTNPWPDYVFSATYKLPSLQEVEAFIKTNKHLPDVPSAKEVETNGLDLGNSQVILLQKIEELTLYVIELKKENEQIQRELKQLKKK